MIITFEIHRRTLLSKLRKGQFTTKGSKRVSFGYIILLGKYTGDRYITHASGFMRPRMS